MLLPTALGGGPSGAEAAAAAALEAKLPRRLADADGERELLRVGLTSLRSLVPSCSGAALFTLPAFSEVTGAVASAEAFAPRLPHAARGALRDALRRVACCDPSTSVAFLSDAAAPEGAGGASEAWCAADSRDWPEGAATFSDWAAAASADARSSSVCFVTLAVAPSRGGPPLAGALLRFENRRLSRVLNAAAALTGWRLLTASDSAPPLSRDAAPLLRCCGVVGDALAARRDKAAAAAALSHATALERDIFPEHLVPAVKARHSFAPMSGAPGGLPMMGGPRSSGVAPIAPQDMLCEAHEDVTVIFCDVCRWTEIAGGMSAQEAMGVLDRLWQRLDTLSVAHGVYKARSLASHSLIFLTLQLTLFAQRRSKRLATRTWRFQECSRSARIMPLQRCVSRWTCTRLPPRRRCGLEAACTAGATTARRASACPSASACTADRSPAASWATCAPASACSEVRALYIATRPWR